MNLSLKNISPETKVFGFTGPVGSGCSEISAAWAKELKWPLYKLTDAIRDKAREQGVSKPSLTEMQNIGNELRGAFAKSKEEKRPGILASLALGKADREWKPEYKGLILDGIKNVGEIEIIRQFPTSFIFSIHASNNVRQKRVMEKRKITEAQFAAIDARDSEERGVLGQQVKKCGYWADIVINNEVDFAEKEVEKKAAFIQGLIKRYVTLINNMVSDISLPEHPPHYDEAFMTMAYCISKRSSCPKRKVGAVIVNKWNQVVSSGYNEVPSDSKGCIFDTNIEGCYREKLQESFINQLAYCPVCGTKLDRKYECSYCGEQHDQYVKTCPICSHDADIALRCANDDCDSNKNADFLLAVLNPGGKLLDMCRALHAEESAIVNLAKSRGESLMDCTLYTTTFPCFLCAKKIAAAKLNKVVYVEPYTQPEAIIVLQENGVQFSRFEGVKSSAFFRLYH